MTSMPIQSVAQDIVDAIKPLVGERTINIMEPGGAIVASSDPVRVGTFHQGAAEAATHRRVVRIQPEQVPNYPGSREGINMPVVKNGELLGVVGIAGRPEEVEQAANLLGACVDLYLDQVFSNRKSQLRKDMLLALLRLMLSGEMVDRDEVLAGGRELRMDLRLPIRALVFVPPRAPGRQHGMEALARMQTLASREGWIDEDCDVSACLDDKLVIMKLIPAGFDARAFAAKTHAMLQEELGRPAGVGLGCLCDDWRQLYVSHREAATLAEMGAGQCLCIDDEGSKVLYMMNSCLAGGVSERYLRNLEQALRRGFGEKDIPRVMETVQAYCEADCRGGKAAESLGIHKNTMNYRMNKIVSLLGMEEENSFVREFFLRLLLLQFSKQENASQR